MQISGLDISKAPNIKDITDKFGTVGNIKKNQYGQASVRCRPDDGLVTVEYEAASSVESAIKWFNDSDIDGCSVKVEKAPVSNPDVSTDASREKPTERPGQPAPVGPPGYPPPGPPGYPPYGPHMGHGHPPPFGPYGHPPPPFGHPGMGMHPRPNVPPRPGDWNCSKCGNSNFQFRTECRRCKVARSEADKGPPGGAPPPPFRHPFRPGFPPRGHPFPPHGHPGMRPPFMGHPRPPFFPGGRMQRPPFQHAGMKRKTPYTPNSYSPKEQKTEETPAAEVKKESQE